MSSGAQQQTDMVWITAEAEAYEEALLWIQTAFTAGSIVLTDLKHCIQRSRLLDSSLNSTVVCVHWHWLQYPPLMNVHCVDKRTWVSVVQRTHVFSINFKSIIGFKYRSCAGETLESTDTVSIVSRLPVFVESPG